MKTEEVDTAGFLAALVAVSRSRAPRPKRQPPVALPRAAATDKATDWTQGKADKVLALGYQLSYDATQRCWAFHGAVRRGPYETVTALLRALEEQP